jgi:hypothetical protein
MQSLEKPEDAMKTTALAITLAVLALAGCHQHVLVPDLEPPAPPRGLWTSTGDNFIELFWDRTMDADLAGYNIYVSAAYEGPYTLIGATRSEYYLDEGARNGVAYYYAVAAYDYEGNESALSKDVAYDIPRPEGYNVPLTNFRAVPLTAGYDFSDYLVVPFNDQYADMWYEYYAGEYYMVVAEDTDIQDMGPTASILDIKVAPGSGWSVTHDVKLRLGHTYVVWTWDDHYAKFRVTGLATGRVVFDWAYQVQKSTPLLKRATTERKPRVDEEAGRERGSAPRAR